MLDATNAVIKVGMINAAFAEIGVTANTVMPCSRKNTERLAWEYYVASHLLRIAEARKKLAVKAAVNAGIMFDPEQQPMVVGTNALVYAGDVVEISVSVATAATKLDITGLFADLVTHRVKRELLDRLAAKHTKTHRAPHTFTSSLATVG